MVGVEFLRCAVLVDFGGCVGWVWGGGALAWVGGGGSVLGRGLRCLGGGVGVMVVVFCGDGCYGSGGGGVGWVCGIVFWVVGAGF